MNTPAASTADARARGRELALTPSTRAGLAGRGNVRSVTRVGTGTATDRAVLAWGALVVVYVLWGSTYLGNRLVVASVPPFLVGGFRFLVAAALLAAVLLAVRGPRAFRMTRAQFWTTALSGLLLPAWGNGLVAFGQQKVSSSLTALLIASVPIWIVVFRRATGDRPRPATLAGVGVGMAGLALLVLAGASTGSAGTQGTAWWGPWLILAAGLGWAAGTFATTRLPVPPNPLAMVTVQMLVGSVILLGVGFGTGERLDVAAVTPVAWWAWVYLAVTSGAAFSAFAYSLGGLPISTVSTYAYVNPVIAVLLGFLVAGERFTLTQILGGVVVLLAVVLVVAAERRPAVAEPSGSGDSMRL